MAAAGCRARRRAGPVRRGARAARAADGRRGRDLARDRPPSRPRAISASTRLASWWHTDADLGRTIETFTDMGRSRRLGFLGVRDTEILVHRPLRPPARRADRAMTGRRGASRADAEEVDACVRFASTPRETSGSRSWPPRPHQGPGEVVVRVATCGICGTDLHEYVAGPDRDAGRAASADRRAEPADPRARVRGRRRGGRARA